MQQPHQLRRGWDEDTCVSYRDRFPRGEGDFPPRAVGSEPEAAEYLDRDGRLAPHSENIGLKALALLCSATLTAHSAKDGLRVARGRFSRESAMQQRMEEMAARLAQLEGGAPKPA